MIRIEKADLVILAILAGITAFLIGLYYYIDSLAANVPSDQDGLAGLGTAILVWMFIFLVITCGWMLNIILKQNENR